MLNVADHLDDLVHYLFLLPADYHGCVVQALYSVWVAFIGRNDLHSQEDSSLPAGSTPRGKAFDMCREIRPWGMSGMIVGLYSEKPKG